MELISISCRSEHLHSLKYTVPDVIITFITWIHYRINPTTMGYISVLIPSVKVNCEEEGIRNTEYILLWF